MSLNTVLLVLLLMHDFLIELICHLFFFFLLFLHQINLAGWRGQVWNAPDA